LKRAMAARAVAERVADLIVDLPGDDRFLTRKSLP